MNTTFDMSLNELKLPAGPQILRPGPILFIVAITPVIPDIISTLSADTISTDITKFSAYKRGGRYGLPMCMGIAKVSGMSEEDIIINDSKIFKTTNSKYYW